MELAAIATAAVPGLAPTGVASLPDDAEDFDSVLIVDAAKNRWRVRSPRHDEASIRLESELAALRAFSAGIRASLPFQLPSVAGTVRQGTLRTFVYNHLPGRQYSLEDLVEFGPKCAKDLGAVMAAIHSMPESAIDRADLPSYSSEQVRQRRLNELDAAATTGMIPSRLLRRWEHAMEDVALWRFNATVIHGDLHEDQLLVEDAKVVAVTGWTDLQVGDPADDFAWLAAVHEQSFADVAFASYMAVRGDRADPHIMRRAALAAEFALAQWLVKAIAGADPQRIAEAKTMLEELDHDIAEYGGQPISVVEPPRINRPEQAVTPPAPVAASPAEATDADDVTVKAPSGKHVERSLAFPSIDSPGAAAPVTTEPATNAMRIVPMPAPAPRVAPAPPSSAPRPMPTAAPAAPTMAPKTADAPAKAPANAPANAPENEVPRSSADSDDEAPVITSIAKPLAKPLATPADAANALRKNNAESADSTDAEKDMKNAGGTVQAEARKTGSATGGPGDAADTNTTAIPVQPQEPK